MPDQSPTGQDVEPAPEDTVFSSHGTAVPGGGGVLSGGPGDGTAGVEATHEELAALNEELAQRNAELSRLTEELRAARDSSESIVAHARVPLIVLDGSFRVKSANHAFCHRFRVTPGETIGRRIYDIGNRQWDIPALRVLLEEMLPGSPIIEDYEVRHDFQSIGPRVMLLNASRVSQARGAEPLFTLSIEDITDRVLAGETRARLAAIVENSEDAIVGKDLDGIITNWNRGAERIFGYTAEEIVGRPVTVLIPEERQNEEVEILGHIRKGEPVEHLETVRRRKDGTLFQASLTASPIMDESGRIVGASKIARDITRQKEAEKALYESGQRFRSAVSIIGSLIWTNTAEGRMEGEQPGWENFTGQTREEYQGYGWAEAVHPDDAQPTIDAWQRALAEKRMFVFEHRVLRADGEWRRCSIRAMPMKGEDGSILEWLGVHTDITEERQAEEKLRASEEFTRSIIDSSPDCIKVLDLEGNLLSLEAGQELLGIPDVTPYIGTCWIDFWASEEDRAAARDTVAAAVAGEEGHFVGFFRTLHGLDKWWDVAISPMIGADGRPVRLLAVSRDVTEQREMEDMLLARAEALAKADRSKDEFLAMLAHELRNPLASLRNAAEVLQAPGAVAEQRDHAQLVLGRQIENMNRMIDDLLDVSRITEGKIELRKSPVELATVLSAAVNLSRSGVAAHGQDLVFVLPSEPVFVDADATRLEQVFGNLLTNACKYGGDGCRIELKVEQDGADVVVSVRDDGAGIAPDLLPRIFDLFVQSSRTLDRAHGGLGIGLTLVHRLVKLHGGSVEARSEGLGHGSEFIVRLPALDGPVETLPVVPVKGGGRSFRMLVVDDNVDAAESFAMLQELRGHVTRVAHSGPAGLETAVDFLPEVVLLDIGLPGMDGYEVARRLRLLPGMKDAFLVAMTGYGTEEDRMLAREAGFDQHLVKPANLDLLHEWLQARAEGTRQEHPHDLP